MITSQKLRRAIPRLGALLVFLALLFVCADALALTCYEMNDQCRERLHRWNLENACHQGDMSACRELNPPIPIYAKWLSVMITVIFGGIPSMLAALIWHRLPTQLTDRRKLFEQAIHMALLWGAWYGSLLAMFLALGFSRVQDLKWLATFSLGFMPLMLCWIGAARAAQDLPRHAQHLRMWRAASLALSVLLGSIPWLMFNKQPIAEVGANIWIGSIGGLICGMAPLWQLHHLMALRHVKNTRARTFEAAHLSRLHERL